MILIRERPQRLCKQLRRLHIDVQIALPALRQHTRGRNDISEIPAFNGLQRVLAQALAVNIKLDGVRSVLDQQKGAAVADQSASNSKGTILLGKRLFGLGTILCLQITSHGRATKIIRKGIPRLAQVCEFGTTLRNEFVIIC